MISAPLEQTNFCSIGFASSYMAKHIFLKESQLCFTVVWDLIKDTQLMR